MAHTVSLIPAPGVEAAVRRMADQIATRNDRGKDVVLVGVQRGGVPLAQRLATLLAERWGHLVPTGSLDVSMHRDDLDQRAPPQVLPTVIPFDLNAKVVVLVDDVLYKGRTVRAALDALNDFGRPRAIQLAVLVDRGHRELPIKADFVGHRLTTAPDDTVRVRLQEVDGEDEVVLEKP